MTRTSPAFLFLLAVPAAACSIDLRGDAIVVREERRFPAPEEVEIALTTFDGSLEVRSWDRPEVLVEVERRAPTGAEAESLEVRMAQEGARLSIDAPAPQGRDEARIRVGMGQSPTVNFRVTGPARMTLDARTNDGSIAVRDLTGRITLRSGDGSVRTDGLRGPLLVDTADGAVVVRDIRGSLDLHTGDGAVDVSGTLDRLRIDTGDGAVRLDAQAGSRIESEWTVQSGDGEIVVRVPRDFDAQVDASSGDGRIVIDGIATATPSNDAPVAQVRTSIGRGGQVLRLRTGDGSITVSR